MVHLRQLYMPVLTKGVLGGLWTALQMRSQGEASPPVVLTRAAGLVLRRGGMLLTGTILVETLFLIPGMGRLLVEAVFHRDAPVIGTIAAIIVGIALLSRFLGNLLLAALEESPPAKTETTKGAESVRALAIGGGVTVGLLFLLLLMPLLTSQDHRAIGTNVKFASPSADSWLGTDQLGRDAFSRVLHGGRNAALISLPMGLLALFVGFAMVVTRVMVARARIPELVYGIEGVLEGLVAVPWLVVGVLIQVVMGPDWPFLALAAILVPRALRVGWALGAGERPEVMHLAPIALRLVALFLAAAVTMSIALSFLGIGIPPDVASLVGRVLHGAPLARGRHATTKRDGQDCDEAIARLLSGHKTLGGRCQRCHPSTRSTDHMQGNTPVPF